MHIPSPVPEPAMSITVSLPPVAAVVASLPSPARAAVLARCLRRARGFLDLDKHSPFHAAFAGVLEAAVLLGERVARGEGVTPSQRDLAAALLAGFNDHACNLTEAPRSAEVVALAWLVFDAIHQSDSAIASTVGAILDRL